MTTKTQAVPRSGPSWRLPIVLLSALGMVALTGAGCTPSIPQEPPPSFVELEFDPSSTPAKAFQPTLLVTNAETGKLDFSAAGIEIPANPLDCPTDDPALPLAACEFYWYMEQLDGFPTLTPGQTPVITHEADGTLVATPIDLNTATVPGNVFVYEFLRGRAPTTDLTVSYDADTASLVFDPNKGWEINGLYIVGIRGYANGIKDTAGNEAVKSIIYVLLMQDVPLTCGVTSATDPALLSCEFYGLFAGDARFASLPEPDKTNAIFATLAQLEQLRALFKGESSLPFDVWEQVAEKGQMTPEEVGILWAFKTHSASVVELNPAKGMVPATPSATEIRLKAKGPIVASSLTAFGFADLHGSVFLIDATEFLAPTPDLAKALPAFTPTYDATAGDIVLTLTDTNLPLVAGHQYIVLLTDLVEGKAGTPIVPSPVTVFLKSRGALVADFAVCATDPTAATPLVPGLKGAEACQLEAGRQQFVGLLDNPDVKSFTAAFGPDGLTREMVMYLYGFAYTP